MTVRQPLLRRAIGPVGVVSIAQLLGTSLWFSANGAADGLMRSWGATVSDIGLLTGAVQGGFILGTLAIALSGLADRFAPSRIFVVAAILGAALNAGFALWSNGLASGMALRFLVGICLAGIYPVGMKLIIGWAPERAGAALSLLVGMLTLGTALPHAMRLVGASVSWQGVMAASSVLALVGATLIQRLGEGPHRKPAVSSSEPGPGPFAAFRAPALRAAALGYFGHMWELYAFWTLVPLLVARAALPASIAWGGVPGLSFTIIGAGAIGCLVGGALSRRIGSAAVAAGALALSGTCCLVFALGAPWLPPFALFAVLIVWGASVIADSPQFSALSAQACPPGRVGSVLAIQNSVGFAITVVSIALSTTLAASWGLGIAWLLLPGPVLGLVGFAPLLRKKPKSVSIS